MLHHGGDQHEALVAEREPVERLVGSIGHAEQGEPLVGDGLLGVGAFRVSPMLSWKPEMMTFRRPVLTPH